MRVNANAVLRSRTLLAAFGGSYAPADIHSLVTISCQTIPQGAGWGLGPGNEGLPRKAMENLNLGHGAGNYNRWLVY